MKAARIERTLIGRDQELATIRRALATRRSCVVLGPAGIGKSALATAAVESMCTTEFTPVIRGLASLSSVPHLPWLPFLHGRKAPNDVEALAGLLRNEIGNRVLLVEDLHWFDEESTSALGLVMATCTTLLTTRETTSTPSPWATATPPCTVVRLDVLHRDEARALVEHFRPGISAADANRVAEAGRGNPFLTILSAQTRDAERHLDPTAALIGAVPPSATRLLALLAAARGPIPDDDLPGGSWLVARGLAVRTEGGRLAVAHDIIAEEAARLLPKGAMRDAHRTLASRADHPVERVQHMLHAGDRTEAEVLGLALVDRVDDISQRAALLELIWRADPARFEIAVAAAEALVDVGRCDRGIEIARSVGPFEFDLERRRLTALARGTWSGDAPDKATTLEALELTDARAHPREAIQLHSVLTRITGRLEWDGAAAMRHATACLRISEAAGLPSAEAHSAMATASIVNFEGGWREHLQRAIELARDEADLRSELVASDTLFVGELIFGDLDACLPLAEAMLTRALEHDVPFAVDRFRVDALLAHLVLDDRPRELAMEATRLLDTPMTQRAREHLAVIALHALADCDRDLDANILLATVAPPDPTDPTAQAMRELAVAEVHLASGRSAEAYAAAQRCLSHPVAGFPAHQMAAPVRSWAAFDLDLDAPEPVGPGFRNAEPFRLEAAGIDALRHSPADSLAAFDAALEAWGDHRCRYTMRCRVGRLEAQARLHGGPDALIDASELAEECQALGFVPLARRVRQLIRRQGGRAAHKPGSRSGLVTGMQEELLELVLEGLTTKAIAARLRISESTVDSSIADAQVALGAATRLAAAVQVRSALGATNGALLRYSFDRLLVRFIRSTESRRTVVDDLTNLPFVGGRLPGSMIWYAEVDDAAGASAILHALLRGGTILAAVPESSTWWPRLLADAQRIASVERLAWPSPDAELPEDLAAVLQLLCEGRSMSEIAETVYASRRTVERRAAQLRDHFGVATNAELVRIATTPVS